MKLTSVEGKIVKQEEIKLVGMSFTKTISVADLAAGIYFLTMENSSYFSTVRVVVQ